MPLIQPEQLDLTRGHRMAMAGRGQKQSQQIQMATYEMQRQAHLKSVLEKDFDNYIKFGTFENRVQFAQHIGSKGAVELAGFLRNMSQEDWDKWHKDAQPEVEKKMITLSSPDGKVQVEVEESSDAAKKARSIFPSLIKAKITKKEEEKKTFQRKTREEEIGGFMVKTDYDFDPSTGEEIPKRVYFSGAEPSQTQVEKFNAMLDESSPEIKAKYKGNLAQWLIDQKKAGATKISIGEQKFEIQKDATAGELRGILTTAKDDKDSFEVNAHQYNKINTKNEVAYWDSKEKWYGDEKTKIIKLSPDAIKGGWTPERVQERATAKGITVKEQLIEMGIIKE